MAGLRTVRMFPLYGKIICPVRIAPVDINLAFPNISYSHAISAII